MVASIGGVCPPPLLCSLQTSIMQILHHPNPHPPLHHYSLSSSTSISPLSLLPKLSSLSLLRRPITPIIRMGGGPRTFPGGVSKWEWKRMQAKKAKQLLKARLARERQIYEMRKRAELKAAVSDLERPWEVVSRAAPNSSALFSVSADEQLKVLADRFQKAGGFDLWSEDDGPQLFETPDGLPTSRFFPKGVVHSIKPYGRVVREGEEERKIEDLDEYGSRVVSDGVRNGEGKKKGNFRDSGDVKGSVSGVASRNGVDLCRRNRGGKLGNGSGNGSFARENQESGDRKSYISGSKTSIGGENGRDHKWGKNGRGGGKRIDGNGAKLKDLEGRERSSYMRGRGNGRKWSTRGGNVGRFRCSDSEDVYDMRLQGDGSYGFSSGNEGSKRSS